MANKLRLGVATAVIVVLSVLVWFEAKQYQCHKRNSDFDQRIASIKQDAHAQLTIGTKKADVARFYAEHKVPFAIVPWLGGYEALGNLPTIGGCTPVGCGTNDALISVRVKVDADGIVIGAPEVLGMYTDCL